MNKIGYLLIIFGAALLVYVGITRFLVYKEQEALIETMTQVAKKVPNNSINKAPEMSVAIGILEIPSINVSVPIVEGSDAKALKYAVGHIPETGKLGEIGQNFCIAGHRSHTFGRFFNRLDEVNENDEFIIKANGIIYKYRVFKKIIVLPEQVEVLNPQSDKSIATLITCHPLYSNKQRLVVYGELIK